MHKNKKVTYMTLWHVTHKDNVASILKDGLLPEKSMSSIKRVWLVRWWGLALIILHITLLKHVPAWQLVVFKVRVNSRDVRLFNRKRYVCYKVIPVIEYRSVEHILSSMEKQRAYIKNVKPKTSVLPVENNILDWLRE